MNKSEKLCCVYLHIRPDTNTVFYVGIGSEKRSSSRRERNFHWNNIVNKNKGEFVIEILCENQTSASVCQMEIALIKFYGRRDKGTGILCNMTDGGEGAFGQIASTVTRQKMVDAWKTRAPASTETRAKMSLAAKGNKYNVGRVHTQEHKDKIKKARLNITQETRNRISKSLIGNKRRAGIPHSEGVKLRLSEVARNPSEITRQKLREASARRKTFLTSHTQQSRTKIAIGHALKNGYLIEQVCILTGVVIDYFASATDAHRKTGIHNVTIGQVMLGKRISAGGFIWRKSYDLSNLDSALAKVAA